MGNYINIDVDINIDDIADQIDDDMVEELYRERFSESMSTWDEIYEKRQAVSSEEFLKFIDQIIQNNTGRVVTV